MSEKSYLDCLVGVFGHPVSENPGVVIQDAAFRDMGLERWHFLTIDIEAGDLKRAIEALKVFKMKGVNCTIPHKIEVMKYLDEISPSAELIGAVNTIVNKDGVLFGENTDGKGFIESLRSNDVDPAGKNIVVLGAGGASRAICTELSLAGASKLTIVNRPEDAHLLSGLMDMLSRVDVELEAVEWTGTYAIPEKTDILVNATPIGLYPNIDEKPDIDYDSIKPEMFVQDVIPNPAVTPLLREAKARGARWDTGMRMLVNQAALNIEMWTGMKPDKAVMLKALEEEFS
jgi:shikimate dehydrogenase